MSVMLFGPRTFGALLALSAHGGRAGAANLKGDAVVLRRAAAANARAFREQYGVEVVPPTAEAIGGWAATISSKGVSEEDSVSSARLLAYNTVTNDGRECLPLDVAHGLCPIFKAADEGCRRLGIDDRPHLGCPICAREPQS